MKVIKHTEPSVFALWQQQLGESLTSLDELLRFVSLSRKQLDIDEKAADLFSLRVPKPFARRIMPANPSDPLLRQVIPLHQELMMHSGYYHDPLNEKKSNKIPGLLHKYFGRALILLSGSCAINCRYCFRRHFAYQDNRLGEQAFQGIIDYLNNHPDIYEVILSGGDPLMRKDSDLNRFFNKLEQVDSLKYLRIHTRLPVVLPTRVTDPLVKLLSETRLVVTLVLHCNHAQEIDSELETAIRKLRNSGITVLNQSVLLKQVNDSSSALIDLSHRLYQIGVLPYYLHLLDAVQGAQHFFVDEKQAQQLWQQMQASLPGFLVPKLVKEVAGATAKVPI